MKYVLVVFFYFLLCLKSNAQHSLQSFINVYNKRTLPEAKRSLQTFAGFQLQTQSKNDTLIANIKGGKITAYIQYKRTNIKLHFTNVTLYKSLFKQAKKKFRYVGDDARVNKETGTFRHTTCFSKRWIAEAGDLAIVVAAISSTKTKKIINYELLLFPFYED